MQKNDPEAAIAQIRSQLKAHPESAASPQRALLHFLLAKLLFDQGAEGDTAEQGLQSALMAVKLKPDLLEARDLLANMYLRSGKYGLAESECRAVLQADATDQVALYHLIVALRHSNAPDRAQRYKVW